MSGKGVLRMSFHVTVIALTYRLLGTVLMGRTWSAGPGCVLTDQAQPIRLVDAKCGLGWSKHVM